MSFTGATTKFSIGSLDDVDTQIDAQYNPKELQFDQETGWKATNSIRNKDAKGSVMEFAGTQSETVKVELLFDGAETNGLIHGRAGDAPTVQQCIAKLKSLALTDASSKDPNKRRRPHFCVATWGGGETKMPRFECVIESMSVKYTMFAKDGTVLRASVTLSLKSAARSVIDRDIGRDTINRDDWSRQRGTEIREKMRADADMERAERERVQTVFTQRELDERAEQERRAAVEKRAEEQRAAAEQRAADRRALPWLGDLE